MCINSPLYAVYHVAISAPYRQHPVGVWGDEVHGTWGLGDPRVEETYIEGTWDFFLICLPRYVSSIPQPIPLSNTGDIACFFFLSYSFSYQLSLRWLTGWGVPSDWFFRSHRDCCLYLFFYYCVYRTPCLRALCTNVILVARDYWGLRMWRKIVHRGIHVGRVVLFASISGPA